LTTMFPSAAASFVVPKVAGGHCDVYIRQADGTESNRDTVYVMPTLAGVENGPRVKPGSTVKIYGTGFSPGASVLINGVGICPPTTFIDAHTLQVVIVRPIDLVESPATAGGEPVQLSVTLGDHEPAHNISNSLPIVLDTFRMLVFGDSTMWGCGLLDEHKFHALVEAKVRKGIGRIGVYRTVAAHNGAIIGNGDTTTGPELNGEVPTKYPTILQQVDKLASLPDAQYVDLVLVEGGINDVQLKVIFDWRQSDQSLISRVEQYCHQDMRVLLTRIASAFPTARIINTGYFAPIADGSNNQLWEQILLSAVAVFGFEIKLPVHMSTIKHRSALFATAQKDALKAAVAETNTALGGGAPRVFFADPNFGPDNGVFCSDPLLWGLKPDLSPEDEIADVRSGICEAQAESGRVAFCKKSSMGHPNVKGAIKYAEAIYPLLA
jgi:lysophospholipase L1-like esterase